MIADTRGKTMSNCPSCGDYLRESIVRGSDGRIQLIDIELCRRPVCNKRPATKQSHGASSSGDGSWVGNMFEEMADFFAGLWQ
jgi:hypothetical protein